MDKIIEIVCSAIDMAEQDALCDAERVAILRAALLRVRSALQQTPAPRPAKPARQPRPVNPDFPMAGKKWTPQEDALLLQVWDSGAKAPDDLSKALGRTPIAIGARLVKLGRLQKIDDWLPEAAGTATAKRIASLSAENQAAAPSEAAEF